MDTKLKKSKIIIGFTAWMLGTLLLFLNLFCFAVKYAGNPAFLIQAKESLGEDYQNTEEFRYYMSDYLNSFLSMAIGGPISQSYDTGYAQETTIEAQAEEGMAFEGGGMATSSDTAEYEGTSDMAEFTEPEEVTDYKKDAQEYHESIKNDRNILYTIEKDGEVLYTNEESLGMYGEEFVLPDGYNYLLYFDGKKVSATKDGQTVDIYGDNYYRTGDGWSIPGYVNFPADKALEGVRICIAAAKVPNVSVSKAYDGDGNSTYYYSNAFYSIQQHLSVEKGAYMGWIYTSLLAMTLLIVSLALNKSRKEADAAIARVTEKLWYEIKLFPLLAILYGVLLVAAELVYQGWWYYLDWDIAGRFWSGEYIGMKVFLTALASLCLGLIWLFINDVRHNERPWKKSIIASLYRLFRTSMLKLPLGKRLIRQYMWVFLAELGAELILLLMLGIWGSRNYEEEIAAFIGVMTLFLMIAVWVCQCFYFKSNKKAAMDMEALVERIEAIHGGKLDEFTEVSASSGLSEAMNKLNEIQEGMNKALTEHIKSERMKIELIANVSHDIKTPLTSIISYVELLKQEDDLPEHVREYISILENKSHRLKAMVQDVFEVSKAASGELPLHMEDLDLGKLLRQTLADMEEQMEEADVTVKTKIPENAVMICADGEHLYRVFQNLILNALKYSLEGSRIYVTLMEDGKLVAASIQNTSKEELSSDIDFTERFIRGDKSRSDGGSGLGLSIAQSFTEACGGTFKVETIADLFVVTVTFPKVEFPQLPY